MSTNQIKLGLSLIIQISWLFLLPLNRFELNY